jgi:uncharacterized membrane protein (UPF0127 family)
MKKAHIAYGVLVMLVIVGAAFFALSRTQPATSSALRTVQLDGQTIRVSIADTEASRELGLGGRTGLAPDEGMLFIFPQDGVYAFWMKDMKFSIDMIWISSSGTVTYMAQNVSPDTFPKDFGPGTPARYVLELPAGWANAHGVRVGDSVAL